MAGLDESLDWEERIKALQGQIDEMKRQQRDEQLERRRAVKDRLCEMKSLQDDERQDRKKVLREQIEEIRRLHKEQQERQKALQEQIDGLKRLKSAEQKEHKKACFISFALKLGKSRDEHTKNDRVSDPGFLQDHGDTEVRKGFLKLHIMGVLAEGPSHGYEIMHRIGYHTGHMWTPSPGSMYPALETLQSNGFISCQGDGRRKVYSLTPKGQNVLDQIRKKQEEQFFEMKGFMSGVFNE